MTRTEWLVKPMASNARMKRGYVATAPECPDGPHPTRDCRCQIFQDVELANAYAAEQSAPAMPTLEQVLEYLNARYALIAVGRRTWEAASNQYRTNVVKTIHQCLLDHGRFMHAAFALAFGEEEGVITPERVLAHAAVAGAQS